MSKERNGFIFEDAKRVAKTIPAGYNWIYVFRHDRWYCIDPSNKDYYEWGITNKEFLRISNYKAMISQTINGRHNFLKSYIENNPITLEDIKEITSPPKRMEKNIWLRTLLQANEIVITDGYGKGKNGIKTQQEIFRGTWKQWLKNNKRGEDE